MPHYRCSIELIKLTDDHATYVTPNEKKCKSSVVYKPSSPHGELYIVKGSTKCNPPPNVIEGKDNDGN